jgi:hypothetical protein
VCLLSRYGFGKTGTFGPALVGLRFSSLHKRTERGTLDVFLTNLYFELESTGSRSFVVAEVSTVQVILNEDLADNYKSYK